MFLLQYVLVAESLNLNSLEPVLNCNAELFGITNEPANTPLPSDTNVPELESG